MKSYLLPLITKGKAVLLVNIELNNKSIGEVYTYNSTENRYENIPQGNLLELELAKDLKEWIHLDFFQFVCMNDHLLSDFHNCSFCLKRRKHYSGNIHTK